MGTVPPAPALAVPGAAPEPPCPAGGEQEWSDKSLISIMLCTEGSPVGTSRGSVWGWARTRESRGRTGMGRGTSCQRHLALLQQGPLAVPLILTTNYKTPGFLSVPLL